MMMEVVKLYFLIASPTAIIDLRWGHFRAGFSHPVCSLA